MGVANSKRLLDLVSQNKEQEAISLLNETYLIDPSYCNSDGDSALHLACSNNLIGLCNALLAYNVELDRKNKFESCPLHIATRMGHDQIVRALLKKGCAVNLESHQGLNALTIAASCNNLSIARLLLEHKARIQDVTLIFAALHPNGAEMCRVLLNHGANVNATDAFGNTALMQSAALAHEKVVNVLVSREWAPIIEINKQNQYGWSALHFAYSAPEKASRERAKANTINALLKKGANTLLKDNEGREPQDSRRSEADNASEREPPRKKRKVSPERERVEKNLAKEFDAVDDGRDRGRNANRPEGKQKKGRQNYQAPKGGRRRGLR